MKVKRNRRRRRKRRGKGREGERRDFYWARTTFQAPCSASRRGRAGGLWIHMPLQMNRPLKFRAQGWLNKLVSLILFWTNPVSDLLMSPSISSWHAESSRAQLNKLCGNERVLHSFIWCNSLITWSTWCCDSSYRLTCQLGPPSLHISLETDFSLSFQMSSPRAVT